VVAVREVGADGAEGAVVAAAAAELDERDRQVALAAVEVAPRAGARLRHAAGAVVAGGQAAVVRVAHHLRPHGLRVAGHQRVGVLGDLLGQQRGVHPAHDHGDAALAVGGGDLVGAPGGEGLDGDRDEVGRGVGVERVDAVVEQGEVDAVRRQPGQQAERERLHARLVDEALVMRRAAQRRLDERDVHRRPPLRDRGFVTGRDRVEDSVRWRPRSPPQRLQRHLARSPAA
jgi:hypothetical protein